jgi:hypothetical protein
MIEQTEHQKAIELLIDAGYETGWVLSEGLLVVWQHTENPPAPLKRPA